MNQELEIFEQGVYFYVQLPCFLEYKHMKFGGVWDRNKVVKIGPPDGPVGQAKPGSQN